MYYQTRETVQWTNESIMNFLRVTHHVSRFRQAPQQLAVRVNISH